MWLSYEHLLKTVQNTYIGHYFEYTETFFVYLLIMIYQNK